MIDPVAHLAGLALQAGGALGAPAEQDHLYQARQMQALSLGWHIVIVCFGVAFPAIVLFVEGAVPAHRRPGLPHARQAVVQGDAGALRRRGRAGTILSFELGILWPEFMARVRGRLRAGLRARGLLVLHRGDLHRDLRVRLGQALAAKVALPDRHPRRDRRDHRVAVRAGGERVDEQPGRLPAGGRPRGQRGAMAGRCSAATSGTSWCTCSIAAYMVAGFERRGRLRVGVAAGPARPLPPIGLVVPFTIAALAAPVQLVVGDWAARGGGRLAANQARGVRGARGGATKGAPIHVLGVVLRRRGEVRRRDPPDAVAAERSTNRTRRWRGSTPCRRTSDRR